MEKSAVAGLLGWDRVGADRVGSIDSRMGLLLVGEERLGRENQTVV